MRRGALLASLLLLPAEASLAQAPAQGPAITKLGTAQGWEAYADTTKGGKICYLIGKPTKTEKPANLKRAAVLASVTHRPAEKRTSEISFDAGYTFKEGSDADLVIDGTTKFSLFTNKNAAWTRDAATDKAVVEALAKGHQAVISGTSSRGATHDTYSLAGFAHALSEIDKACGVKR
jgi:hypothetical protein